MNAGCPWFKIILLGEAGVGKTSIFHRVKDNVFRSSRRVTVCIDSCTRTVKHNDQLLKLTLWDTAGVERFRTLTRNYYRNAHGAILVYSVDQPLTLYDLTKWVEDVHSFCPEAVKFILGNKTDLEQLVNKETAQDFAQTHGCECLFLSSAKSGSGIEPALKKITEKVFNNYTRQALHNSMNIFDESIDINKNQKTSAFSTCSC